MQHLFVFFTERMKEKKKIRAQGRTGVGVPLDESHPGWLHLHQIWYLMKISTQLYKLEGYSTLHIILASNPAHIEGIGFVIATTELYKNWESATKSVVQK